MSRIQNILEKAEREGTVHRVRPIAEPAVAAPVAALDSIPIATSGLDASPAPTRDTAVPMPGRVVTSTRLDPKLITATASDAIAAEQYRALRTRILHTDNGAAVNVVLVTSPGFGEGKSLTVANLGLTMAQEYQRRICIVDANLRRPDQHRLFGIADGTGLADVLAGGLALDDAFITLEDHHITLLPGGTAPAHPAELLGTTTMRRTLETLRSRFDCVLIDAPPASPLADVGILTPLVDSVLIVVRAGITAKPAIHDAVGAIDHGKLLGIVLNDAA
jgi:capsular exopolysaccharide synthesis family protein